MGLLEGLFGGGGPSAAQQSLANKESTLANEFMEDYGTMFRGSMDTLNSLRSQYASLTAQGPNQHGFNSPVLNALNTQLLASSNAAYLNASATVRNFMAGQGGGAASGVTSGISGQIMADVASKAANALALGQTQLTMKDYEVGRENFFRGLTEGTSLAGMQSQIALGLGKEAGTQLSAARAAQKDIDAQKQAARAAKFGAITGLAKAGLGMVTGGLAAIGPGESFSEGAKDFMSGAFGGVGSPAPGGGIAGLGGETPEGGDFEGND